MKNETEIMMSCDPNMIWRAYGLENRGRDETISEALSCA